MFEEGFKILEEGWSKIVEEFLLKLIDGG